VGNHSIERIGSDFVRLLRVNPERSMLVALAAGFIFGMAFTSHDD
jgi:hypothetical protein